ncbi:MAG: aryl-sulfate sulfotransferase [Bacteroidales bacterium]|nr:aryl-sulfate sulfotransferase [Bacteroidales bacterium]
MKTNKVLLIILLLPVIGFAQQKNTGLFQYLLPMPGNNMVTQEQNIVIRHGSPYHPNTPERIKAFVKDENGNDYPGEWTLSVDNRSLIFNHDKPFERRSRVTVFVSSIMLESGKTLPGLRYSFKIRKQPPRLSEKSPADFNFQLLQEINGPSLKKDKWPELPDDLAQAQVTISNDPSQGYFFATTMTQLEAGSNSPYLIMLDNVGYPVYYKKLGFNGKDFKIQPNGQLSYFSSVEQKHLILNNKFEVVDSYEMKNGYPIDFHEFRLLENGHALLLGYDDRLVDMDTVVPGGHENVTVRGALIQEFDSDKNLVFQWSSFNHFDITDATDYVNLQSESVVDYVHANAIEQMPDGDLLLSSRNMNEITRIDGATGEMVWRFSGENNDFDFVNDTLGFSMQHHIRYQGNNRFSLFDNGWFNTNESFSSAVEYELDRDQMNATMTKRLRSQPEDIYGKIMGSVQYMPNNRIVVGWGSGRPNITEFRQDGSVALELTYPSSNYRAYKFDFTQEVFHPLRDSVDFGYIVVNETANEYVGIQNNSDTSIQINHCNFRSKRFKLNTPLPMTIPAGESVGFELIFDPGEHEGRSNDVATFCYDTISDDITQRIAVQVKLTGYASLSQNIDENSPLRRIYPNPGNGMLNIDVRNPFNGEIRVLDVNGATLHETQKRLSTGTTLDLTHLDRGMYIIQIRNMENESMEPIVTKVAIR